MKNIHIKQNNFQKKNRRHSNRHQNDRNRRELRSAIELDATARLERLRATFAVTPPATRKEMLAHLQSFVEEAPAGAVRSWLEEFARIFNAMAQVQEVK